MSLIQLKLDYMRGPIPPIPPKHGCWIAGGAVRRWFLGTEKLSDIDVFAPSAQCFEKFIAEHDADLVDSHKHADTYEIDGVKVQCIKFHHPTPEALVQNFDFNICQFVWTEVGAFATANAIIGALRGHLAVEKINPEFAVDSLRRAFKYQRRGFTPCAGTLRDIANSFLELTKEQIENQVSISPKGGRRIVRID